MHPKKLDYFKDKLLQKQASLNAMVQRTEGYGREKEPDTQDMADMAVESYTKEFMFGKSSADRRTLADIRSALKRIDTKSYGICGQCDEPIEDRRLEAVPWTQYCLACQSLSERGLLDN